MASDTAGVLEDAADTLDLVHQVSSNIEMCVQTVSAVKVKEVGEISTRMAALTDRINMCNAVLDDLNALKVLVDKSLPDVYLKSQPEPGEPLPKMSP